MFQTLGVLVTTALVSIFAASPTSTNFTLKTYDFGNGGGSISSTNYQLNGLSGGQAGANGSSTNYVVQSDQLPTQNANVPLAPTLSNPSSLYYDRLQLIISNGGNPTDTRFAIAISSDGFASTQYVQSDNTVGVTLALNDYQTYTAWGGGSGFFILGLSPNTTYQVKVKALQGSASGSAYSPVSSSVATVLPSITFSVETGLTATPPFAVSFASLAPNTVYSGNTDIITRLTTNALHGGSLYIRDTNAGLSSSTASYTLSSATVDLSSVALGYGAQVVSTSQVSGGPLSSLSPYNLGANNVGGLITTLVPFATSSSSVTTGIVTTRLKALTNITVPSTSDYSDTLTFVAAMLF